MAVVVRSKAKRFDAMDFVPTISDSESDVPDLDASDEEDENKGDGDGDGNSLIDSKVGDESNDKGERRRKGKKAKKISNGDYNDGADLNKDFRFDLQATDGFGGSSSSGFSGWDFFGHTSKGDGSANDDGTGSSVRKDVNLDDIIKRKGGQISLAHMKDKNSAKDVLDSEDKDSSQESGEEEEEEENEREESGTAAPPEEASEDNTESSDDEAALEGSDEIEGDEDEEEEEEPEAVAKFYAPETEAEEAKRQTHTNFNSFSLSRPVLKGLANLGYVKPTPVQSATIPIALLGKDIVAGAVTGSGKTAAFMIPIIERLLYKPARVASTRVIVLTPTRELAIQVADVGRKIAHFVSGITFGLAVGGLNLRQQEQELKSRPDVVIATPGRLIDHIRNSASFNVDTVEILVIDEADRMLEEGFQDELNEIMQLLPTRRQTLLFSATMNSKIKQMVSLSLKKPVRIMIDPPKQAASKLVQEFVRIRKKDEMKPALLYNLLRQLDSSGQRRIVVFVSRKDAAHRLRIVLGMLGMSVAELHGSLTQEQRLESVNKFKALEVSVLICTDLASRGLDIPKIEVVINYDMPKTYDIYLHRVGRTARAGRDGRAISFVGETAQERSIVKDAIKSVEEGNKMSKYGHQGRALSRNVDWHQVEETHKAIEKHKDTIEEILVEEKQEKEILLAEMELKKSENMLKYKDEIHLKPKRTWFQTEAEKKNAKVASAFAKTKKEINSKRRKRQEALEDLPRSYKKTQKDRIKDQERTFKKQKVGSKNKNKKGAKAGARRK